MKKIKTSDVVKCAISAAVICVFSPISFQIAGIPIPISLSTFAVCLIAGIVGKYRGLIAAAVYIALGAVGFPVFTFFTGGFHKIAGPTGGYIVGYLPCVFIAGFIIDLLKDKFFIYPIGMAAGVAACYLTGTIWYCIYAKCTFVSALLVCVVPFIAVDAVKIAAASVIAYNVRKVTDRL